MQNNDSIVSLINEGFSTLYSDLRESTSEAHYIHGLMTLHQTCCNSMGRIYTAHELTEVKKEAFATLIFQTLVMCGLNVLQGARIAHPSGSWEVLKPLMMHDMGEKGGGLMRQLRSIPGVS